MRFIRTSTVATRISLRQGCKNKNMYTYCSFLCTADNLSMMLGCSSLQQVGNVRDKMLSMVVVHLYIHPASTVVFTGYIQWVNPNF